MRGSLNERQSFTQWPQNIQAAILENNQYNGDYEFSAIRPGQKKQKKQEKYTGPSEERKQFKMLMQQKQLLTASQVAHKKGAMKSYFGNKKHSKQQSIMSKKITQNTVIKEQLQDQQNFVFKQILQRKSTLQQDRISEKSSERIKKVNNLEKLAENDEMPPGGTIVNGRKKVIETVVLPAAVPQKSQQLEVKTLGQVNIKNAQQVDSNFAALTNAFFAATIDMKNEYKQPRQLSGQVDTKNKSVKILDKSPRQSRFEMYKDPPETKRASLNQFKQTFLGQNENRSRSSSVGFRNQNETPNQQLNQTYTQYYQRQVIPSILQAKEPSTEESIGNPQDIILPSPHLSGLAAYKQQKLQKQGKSEEGVTQPDRNKHSFLAYNAMKSQVKTNTRGRTMTREEDRTTQNGRDSSKLLVGGSLTRDEKSRSKSRGEIRQRMQVAAVSSLKENLFKAWTMFGKQTSEDQVILKAFKTNLDDADHKKLAHINQKLKCNCEKDPQFKFTCKKGLMWFANNREMLQKIRRKIQEKPEENEDEIMKMTIKSEYKKCKSHFKSLMGLEPKSESAQQIERDLGRTFPKNEFFKVNNNGFLKLRNVLRAFACYDTQVDYVQGMNFIVGQLLIHCSETLAFWLFIELIEECELRDTFQNGLPGLNKHVYCIRLLVKKHLPSLHDHFEEHNVSPQMYASDWIFSIFTSVLPETDTNVTSAFFSLFFKYKWEFFYKLVLTILSHIQPQLLAEDDMFSVLQQVKIAMSNKNDPYNYASKKHKTVSEPKNFQDEDLESVAGSVQKEKPTPIEQPEVTPVGGLFGGMRTMLGFGQTPGAPEETTPEWEEFPWERYLIKEDIIKKWKQVDMKLINNLHSNFDVDQGQFVNINLEKVSVVKTAEGTYSQIEGLN